MSSKTLVVMAAGMGSRFGGLKQIEPVSDDGRVLLDYSVYDAKKAGFDKVVFIIKKQIEKDFREKVGKRIENFIDVDYCFQELNDLPFGFKAPKDREKPYGTGQAVLCCKDTVNTPFAVINADDYYGPMAYRQIFKGLDNAPNYCMVGFRLANTLTENGTVSRGICNIKDGKLLDIVEKTKIADCKYFENDIWHPLSPDTIVSMNMWGFQTDIFEYLERGFKEFFAEKGQELKSEFFLPFMVDDLIKAGEKSVDVLVAEDKWYGMTYKEDTPAIKKAIADMIANGIYKF